MTSGYHSQSAGKSDLLLALLEARIEERAASNAEHAAGLAGVEGLRSLLRTNARLGHEDAAWTQLVIEFRLVAARDVGLNARYAALHARTVEHSGLRWRTSPHAVGSGSSSGSATPPSWSSRSPPA